MSKAYIFWDEEGLPHSSQFGDKFFCQENGFEETMFVSCGANQLPQRFAALDPKAKGVFTILETGFGTGLNFCCAWKIWREYAPRSWTLSFVSLDRYPMTADQMNRALSLWSILDEYRQQLVSVYAPQEEGKRVMPLDQGRVVLTIVFDEVVSALKQMKAQHIVGVGADAIFFDGFSPAKNPQMWSYEVFQAAYEAGRQGTTFATFTVAGWVRRNLMQAGFVVEKVKGYGTKKHILIGTRQ